MWEETFEYLGTICLTSMEIIFIKNKFINSMNIFVGVCHRISQIPFPEQVGSSSKLSWPSLNEVSVMASFELLSTKSKRYYNNYPKFRVVFLRRVYQKHDKYIRLTPLHDTPDQIQFGYKMRVYVLTNTEMTFSVLKSDNEIIRWICKSNYQLLFCMLSSGVILRIEY